jgi:hypothetical protein
MTKVIGHAFCVDNSEYYIYTTNVTQSSMVRGEGVKNIAKRLIRDEKGQALILAMILLLVGGLIAASLLAHMGSGLIAGEVYESRTAELYAADAGVEDAVWKIQAQVPEVEELYCGAGNHTWSYNISDVNDKDVEVTIAYVNNTTYSVNSTATGDGSGTRIEAYISGTPVYMSLLDHLITIQEDLDDKEIAALEDDLAKLDIDCPINCTECEKCAKAYDYDSEAYREISKECKGCIAVYNLPTAAWPTEGTLSARYWEDVKNETPYGYGNITLNGNNITVGPLYRYGTLKILNDNNKEAATLTLNGTLYITGHTEIGMDGGGSNKPNLTIELKGKTIFVACNYTKEDGYALEIGPWCTINGPGAIIAVGDIYFQPNGDVGINAKPALILSVSGTTMIQPNINFLGAIGGKIDVDLQSGHANVDYPAGGFEDINFPSLFEAYLDYSIASWEVSPL